MGQIELKSLKGYNCFDFVFKVGRKISNQDALLVVSKKYIENLEIKNIAYNGRKTIFFGVTVPKKIAKKAVMRNRVKRLLRVSIINYFKALSQLDYDIQMKYLIIVWRKVPKHPALINLSDVSPVIDELLNKYLKININTTD